MSSDAPGLASNGKTQKIRLAVSADGLSLAAIYAPFVDGDATSFELVAPTGDEMAARVEKTTARTPWLVCERNAEVLGYAYASPHRDRAAYQWSVEVSAYIRQDARRAGVATGLYRSLFSVLSLQGFRMAYAGITVPNAMSTGFHQSQGFTLVGVYRNVGYKLGEWRDVAWFDRALAAPAREPAPPIPLPAIATTAGFPDALSMGVAALRL
jgi:phosphinothricin acetyltransferase